MESINLNHIPSGVTPVCHVSQYDDKRKIRLNLFNGTAALSITATMTFELQVRKPDNTIVTTAPTGTTNNTAISAIGKGDGCSELLCGCERTALRSL